MRKLLTFLLALTFSLGFVACDNKAKEDSASEEVEETVEEAGDSMEEAAEDVEEATEEAAEIIEEEAEVQVSSEGYLRRAWELFHGSCRSPRCRVGRSMPQRGRMGDIVLQHG